MRFNYQIKSDWSSRFWNRVPRKLTLNTRRPCRSFRAWASGDETSTIAGLSRVPNGLATDGNGRDVTM